MRWVYENLPTVKSVDFSRLLRIESAFDIALVVAATAMACAFITKPSDKRHP